MTPPAHAQHTPAMNAPVPPVHERALLSMIGNMEQLSTVYKVELDALELRDMKLFSDIQAEKNKLVQDCEAHMAEISKNSALLKMVSPALKERVLDAEDNLRRLALKSQHACEVRAASVLRIQERLLEAARHIMMRDKTLYNKHGVTDTPRNKPVATAINQAI
jgi:flagellar biosynthesis/type III secretory pathway chaperone